MKVKKIIKKLVTAVMILTVVGMLAGCSNGGDNSSESKTEKYKMLYDGIIIRDGVSKTDIDSIDQYLDSTDYDISGTTLTFTESGFSKFLTMNNCVAILVYENKMVKPIGTNDVSKISSGLTEVSDYTLSTDGKVYTLTSTGYTNVFDVLSGSGGQKQTQMITCTKVYRSCYYREPPFGWYSNSLKQEEVTVDLEEFEKHVAREGYGNWGIETPQPLGIDFVLYYYITEDIHPSYGWSTSVISKSDLEARGITYKL